MLHKGSKSSLTYAIRFLFSMAHFVFSSSIYFVAWSCHLLSKSPGQRVPRRRQRQAEGDEALRAVRCLCVGAAAGAHGVYGCHAVQRRIAEHHHPAELWGEALLVRM